MMNAVNCTTCDYYREYRAPEVLNPNKTVTRGHVVQRHCRKGGFDLMDLKPCELYNRCDNPSARIPFPPKPNYYGNYSDKPKTK